MMLKTKSFNVRINILHLWVFLLLEIVFVSGNGNTSVSKIYQRKRVIHSSGNVGDQLFGTQYIHEFSVDRLNHHRNVLNSLGTHQKTLFNSSEIEETQYIPESSAKKVDKWKTVFNLLESEGAQQRPLFNTSGSIRNQQNPVKIVGNDQKSVKNVGINQEKVEHLQTYKNTVEKLGADNKTLENVGTHHKTVGNVGINHSTLKNSETHQIPAENVGSPLFLTPYIEKGLIREAQQLSKVKPFIKGVTSYAGLLTVNKNYDSNLFFWFFPSKTDWTNSPIAVWLQGGPGGSSLYGLFKENGPYIVDKDQKLKLRKYSWHRKCNMIYIDSPVGTGYSFTRHQDGYARNQTRIGDDLYEAIKQFLIMFPQIRSNPFYITGESYAGKFIPALGYSIHTHNAHSSFKINLQGLLIGNGLTDPENMIPVYADVLYGLGFIDYNQKAMFEQRQKSTVHAIQNKDWDTATLLYSQLIIGYSFFPYPTFYTNSTGLSTYYNYVNENSAKWYDYENSFVISSKFRRHVHVGNLTRDRGDLTESFMRYDIAKSVINWVKELVEHYRVTFYNGQLDIICAYPLTENFLRKMEWSGARKFRVTRRKLWKIDGELAGYVRRSGNLADIMVRNSGHMVPTDQPKWAYHLFNNFIYNRTF